MDQNAIVPTRLCLEKKVGGQKFLKGQSIFGLKLGGQNIAWTKCKGTKCFWTKIV